MKRPCIAHNTLCWSWHRLGRASAKLRREMVAALPWPVSLFIR